MLSRPLRFGLLAAALLAACSTNVPQGFDSGTSLATRDVAAPADRVYAAAIDVLRERGDAVEEEKHELGGVLRTGRFRVVVEPLPGEMTHLDVFVARYVGVDHEALANDTLDAIVARVR